jgi:hypothetical protein
MMTALSATIGEYAGLYGIQPRVAVVASERLDGRLAAIRRFTAEYGRDAVTVPGVAPRRTTTQSLSAIAAPVMGSLATPSMTNSLTR